MGNCIGLVSAKTGAASSYKIHRSSDDDDSSPRPPPTVPPIGETANPMFNPANAQRPPAPKLTKQQKDQQAFVRDLEFNHAKQVKDVKDLQTRLRAELRRIETDKLSGKVISAKKEMAALKVLKDKIHVTQQRVDYFQGMINSAGMIQTAKEHEEHITMMDKFGKQARKFMPKPAKIEKLTKDAERVTEELGENMRMLGVYNEELMYAMVPTEDNPFDPDDDGGNEQENMEELNAVMDELDEGGTIRAAALMFMLPSPPTHVHRDPSPEPVAAQQPVAPLVVLEEEGEQETKPRVLVEAS